MLFVSINGLVHVPAVADMLERLKVVVALAKQDDRNRV